MPTIAYTDPAGVQHEVDAPVGETVADVALKAGVPGIIAECGGALSCASCHVYVDEQWQSAVGPAVSLEDDMLDGALAERVVGSRLSCQLKVTSELDGLSVVIPAEQM
ncbi:2Fe-2S iron-sulfur cluster-binding protein [Rhodococcus koreensis]|uniref:2Fe-2S iron-sulfur cluster-binding protein n=1 Tax=Rhodococcus koreensis TaxID=99653 RepID=UPI003672F816